jgi:nucleoid DNA-binding protein
MTKADLIEEVSRAVKMTKRDSEVIVEAIFDSILRSLRTGDKIEIRGFGSFRMRQRQARLGCSLTHVNNFGIIVKASVAVFRREGSQWRAGLRAERLTVATAAIT